ncbi:MAG: serine kinase [Chloroflexi bacterium]|nr:serine kinase [Chloroflexota bacterium]
MIARSSSGQSALSVGSPPSPGEEPSPPQAFFESAWTSFHQAAAGRSIDRDYSIAGFPVRLRFLGAPLVDRLARAFAHLSTPPALEPALTVCILDSRSTNTALPPRPEGADDVVEGGAIRGLTDERFRMVFDLDLGLLRLLDMTRGRGIYWLRSTDRLPDYEAAAPMRVMLHLWLHSRGLVPAHAGAVGLPDGGVLLVGQSGSGKSNTALACLDSVLGYASDDFCVLDRRSGGLWAHSLYSTAKVQGGDVPRLPFLAPLISNPDRVETEKAVVYLYEHLPGKILAGFPIKAILIPRVTGSLQTTLEPATPFAALIALAPSTSHLAPSEPAGTFQSLAEIVRQTGDRGLNLGSEPGKIPQVILELLARLAK